MRLNALHRELLLAARRGPIRPLNEHERAAVRELVAAGTLRRLEGGEYLEITERGVRAVERTG